jgi:PAS domain S-box-containing protein
VQDLYNNAPCGYHSLDRDGTFVQINDTELAWLGYTREEVLGRMKFSDILTPDNLEIFEKNFPAFKERGWVRDLEFNLVRKDGTFLPVLLNSTAIKDEAGHYRMSRATVFDLTARKTAEEAMKAERQRFYDVLEMLPAYIVLLNPDYQVSFANRYFVERFGESRGRRCFEYLFGGIEPCENCETYTVFKTNAPHHWEKTGPDGRHYDIYDYPFTDVDGSPLIMEMGIDITDRKRAEADLRRVNRALRTLSECNRALARATSEADLLKQICRLIVEEGSYRLAWVGYAEDDQAKTVRPMAQAGYEAGYLETLQITWADTERGRGPTGTAIRTGKPTMARNILTDPFFEPWRAEAVKRGYASSCVLPLHSHRQVWGALNIYAAEPDAFGPEEMKLLSDLAANLAFGIMALRTQAARLRDAAALRESEKKLRTLTSQLLTVQEEERRRLSRELHDGLGQTLLVLKLQMRALERRLQPDQEALRRECDQNLHQIDGIIEDVRRMSRALSPSVLEDLGLTVALRHLCEEFAKLHENLSLSLELDDISGMFPKEAEINIYRIFQESLSNIGKYAQARGVSLAVKKQDGKVAFAIEDNGRGFQLEEVQARDGTARGLGLATMTERVRMLGGDLHLSSQRGAGTRVSFTLPGGMES